VPDIVPLFAAPIKHLSLSSTARVLARPSLSVEPEDSLALAASRFIQNGSDILPVIQDGRVIGAVTGQGLSDALGDAIEPSDAVGNYLSNPVTLRAYATGAEALRSFEGGTPLIVVDEDDRLVGLLSPADLFPRQRAQLRPPLVGGMATPFGVYLTSGTAGAGVPKYALISSGAAITAMFSIAIVLGQLGSIWLHRNGLAQPVSDDVQVALTAVLFAALFRLVPLSGIHGAEHQVVHAIERELELVPSVVKRMPLVHPRCGTNFSVGITLFLGIFEWEWSPNAEYRLALAVTVTLLLWRPLGRLTQKFVTTKRPTEKQLDQAIAAGRELLSKYASVKTGYPNIGQRIWNTGIVYVLIGSLAIGALVASLTYMFHQPVFQMLWG
jgi:CBS domain-containing protein